MRRRLIRLLIIPPSPSPSPLTVLPSAMTITTVCSSLIRPLIVLSQCTPHLTVSPSNTQMGWPTALTEPVSTPGIIISRVFAEYAHELNQGGEFPTPAV